MTQDELERLLNPDNFAPLNTKVNLLMKEIGPALDLRPDMLSFLHLWVKKNSEWVYTRRRSLQNLVLPGEAGALIRCMYAARLRSEAIKDGIGDIPVLNIMPRFKFGDQTLVFAKFFDFNPAVFIKKFLDEKNS